MRSRKNTHRGYFGIGIENAKSECNLGTLWRSAYSFGAQFIFTIGRRYKLQSGDTTKTFRHIPLFEYQSVEDFYGGLPRDCQLVGLEFPHESARPLGRFTHPDRCVYLLGAEDHGLTKKALALCHHLIYIPSKLCLNVSTAGSIVMYDRAMRREEVRQAA